MTSSKKQDKLQAKHAKKQLKAELKARTRGGAAGSEKGGGGSSPAVRYAELVRGVGQAGGAADPGELLDGCSEHAFSLDMVEHVVGHDPLEALGPEGQGLNKQADHRLGAFQGDRTAGDDVAEEHIRTVAVPT